MKIRALITVVTLAAILTSPALAQPTSEVLSRSEVVYQPLNPARGDASPKAGVLWGDIKQDLPTGVLLEFADGFSSPPHIHNITYRAVVIEGAVHNDDPDAEKLWMGPGSFWTQPAGESHITAAAPGGKGRAFLEILQGPYLVKPSAEAFDNGERPINVVANNIIWLDSADVTWIKQASSAANAASMAFLWGKPESGHRNGSFVKLPAGFSGHIRGNDAWLRAVIIQGLISHQTDAESKRNELEPGSYFGSTGSASQHIACSDAGECVIYVSTEGKYEVVAR